MRVQLKDIASFSKGKQINGDDLVDDGKYAFLNGGINPSGKWHEYNVEGNSIAISEGGNSSGYVNYMEEPFWCGAHCYFLYDLKYDSKYIYYALKSQQDSIMQLRSGACMPNIKKSSLGDFEFFIEEDTHKQALVVSTLDKVDGLIALRKEQLAKMDELVKARFVEMFGNNTDSGVPLRDCCIDVRGGGTPSMQHPEYYGGNVPFIKSGDVRGDLVHSGTLWLTEKALSDTPAKFVPKGAVLVVNRSAALLREFRAAIAEQPVVINQDIKAFIPKPEYASEYLLWAIKIQTQYLLTRVTTVLTSHIDLKDLLELKIMPASCEEQALFTQFISETNKTKLTIQASLDKLEVMKKALMQEYFG